MVKSLRNVISEKRTEVPSPPLCVQSYKIHTEEVRQYINTNAIVYPEWLAYNMALQGHYTKENRAVFFFLRKYVYSHLITGKLLPINK
jgi:hypothetical protein